MDKKSVANEINNFSIYILDEIIFSEGQYSRWDYVPIFQCLKRKGSEDLAENPSM
jgi:hypothetical protein